MTIYSRNNSQFYENEITVYCTKNFSRLGFEEQLARHVKYTVTEEPNPRKDDGVVGWNKYKVLSETEGQPYTDELSCCIALLGRAQNALTQEIYTGVAHIYDNSSRECGVEVSSRMLGELKEKTNNATIQLFIAGGTQDTELVHQNLLDVVKKVNNQHPQRQAVQIIEDLFGLIKKTEFCAYYTKFNEPYRGHCGISQTGFDKNSDPYVIFDATLRGSSHEVDYRDLTFRKEYSELEFKRQIEPRFGNSVLVYFTNSFYKFTDKQFIASIRKVTPQSATPFPDREGNESWLCSVPCNGYRVPLETERKRPYIKELDLSSIAVLGWSKNISTGQTYTGATRLYDERGLAAVSKMLEKLKEKTTNLTIKVFIFSAGNEETKEAQSLYQKVCSLIHKNESVQIVEKLFGLIKKTKITVYDTKSDTGYFGSRGISQTGFDGQYNPYVVLDLTLTGYEDNYENLVPIRNYN